MRRRMTSMWMLVALLVVVTVLGVVSAWALARQSRAHGEAGLVQTGRVVATLTTSRLTAPDQELAGISAATATDLRGDVAALRHDQGIIGLRVWSPNGTLLFADPAGSVPTPPRLAQVVAGTPVVELNQADLAGAGLDHVLVPVEPDHDLTAEAVVEVLLPNGAIAAHQRRDEWIFFAGIGAAYLLLAGMLLRGRQRVRRREAQALVDPLTGIGNRTLLEAQPTSGGVALLMLDLDRFKSVNDTLGHSAGDELLRQVAAGLRDAVRVDDVVARVGGDEFAVLLRGLRGADDARRAAENLRARLASGGYQAGGIDLDVEASIGIALAPEHGDTIERLLQSADVAMYQAKTGGTGVEVYDQANDPHDADRLVLLSDLRRAIIDEQLVLHYQPKASLTGGDITGVEALVRWQHPERGLLPPGAFIPVIENTGLIHPLTEWVVDRAIAQAAAWGRAGIGMMVSINVSPRSVNDALVDHILRALATHQVQPAMLEVEITETAVAADPLHSIDVLRRLRATGVRISLDDFGAGYTSLAYLTGLPLDTLKIDMGFITRLTEDRGHEAVTAAVIELGHRLGLTVLAEGVETDATRDRLESLGCDQMQGFLLTEPVPAKDLERWLRERAGTVTAALPGYSVA